jgi:prepilin-type N-terminal cleavage/methylation domain-containing protein
LWLQEQHMKLSSRKLQQGFSLIELVVVVAVMSILSSIAIMSTMRPGTTARANNAADAVVNTLRQGRLLAITKRRNVQVNLTGTNQIQLTVQTLPGEAAPAIPIPLVQLNDGVKSGLQFYLFPTLPNTPMGPLGFGNTSALDFEAVNGGTVGNAVMFSSSGSFVGVGGAAVANYYTVGNSDPINATIYIGTQGDTSTARAITVTGATGRVRSFSWNGTAWKE